MTYVPDNAAAGTTDRHAMLGHQGIHCNTGTVTVTLGYTL